jgi:hypothetical protein
VADHPPYMNAYGNVQRILERLKTAETPEKFTQDFLATVLGFSGGGAKPFIPLAKRMGLLNSDGTPTALYHRIKNRRQSGAALAEAIRIGYPELFRRNQYAHKLSGDDLEGLVMEVTGLSGDAQQVRSIAKTFQALVEAADFDGEGKVPDEPAEPATPPARVATGDQAPDLRFSYTIYLNLPNTSDIAVFNAIFKSLRENLLR